MTDRGTAVAWVPLNFKCPTFCHSLCLYACYNESKFDRRRIRGVSTVTSRLKEPLHPVFLLWKETGRKKSLAECVCVIVWKGPDGRVGQGGGGTGAGCRRAREQGEGLWEGPGPCSLALPWCMNSVSATWIFCPKLKLGIMTLYLI